MQFARDGSMEREVQWYFVDNDTPVIDMPTPFRSKKWWPEYEGPDLEVLGEVEGAERIHTTGLPNVPTAGGPPCGTPDQWHNGLATEPAMPVPVNVYGGPACCPLPPEPFLFYGCQSWTAVWSVYSLLVTGATGTFAALNGEYQMDFVGAIPGFPECNWTSPVHIPLPPPPPFSTWIMSELTPGIYPHPTLLLNSFPTNYGFHYDLTNWNALELFEAPIVFDFGPVVGPPPFVVILPGLASAVGPFCPAQGQFLPQVLVIHFQQVILSVSFGPITQDSPFTYVGPCTYSGLVLWSTVIPYLRFIPVVTRCTLTFGPGDLITLSGTTPLFSPFTYTANAAMWDGSPIALVLHGGPTFLFGMPATVLLYTQSDLPP